MMSTGCKKCFNGPRGMILVRECKQRNWQRNNNEERGNELYVGLGLRRLLRVEQLYTTQRQIGYFHARLARTRTLTAKFHYASCFEAGSKLVADLQRAEIWPII